jgi:hypothetical protein
MSKKSSFLIAGLSAVAVAGGSAASASALTIHPTDGTALFPASGTNHTLTVDNGNGALRASTVTLNGSTTAGGADSHAVVHPVLSGTTFKISGVTYPAAAAVGGAGWLLTLMSPVSPFSIGVEYLAPMSITVTGLTGALTLPLQVRSGSSAVNSGLNMNLSVSLSGLEWSTTVGSDLDAILGGGATPKFDGVYKSNGSVSVAGVNIS